MSMAACAFNGIRDPIIYFIDGYFHLLQLINSFCSDRKVMVFSAVLVGIGSNLVLPFTQF